MELGSCYETPYLSSHTPANVLEANLNQYEHHLIVMLRGYPKGSCFLVHTACRCLTSIEPGHLCGDTSIGFCTESRTELQLSTSACERIEKVNYNCF